jgi:hypothetical protein
MFLTRLSLFKIGDASAFVIKITHTFCSRVHYASKGRHTLLGMRLPLVTKAGASPFIRKGRQGLL